jgi:hypothetical protein
VRNIDRVGTAAKGAHVRAAHALRSGDLLGVLKNTQGSDDPRALALRAIALTQLDERRAARACFVRAEHAFTKAGDELSALRARLAEAEMAVADPSLGNADAGTDLTNARRRLISLAVRLREHEDHANAAWALVVAARAASLQGDAEGAGLLLERCRDEARDRLPPHVDAVLAMAEAAHAARMLRADDAHAGAARAVDFAARARHPALMWETRRLVEELNAPMAMLADGRALALREVAKLVQAPRQILVDACRACVTLPGSVVDFKRKPALFELFVTVARAAPGPSSADTIAREAFGARVPNASHFARLRVELGRLRRMLGTNLGDLVLERRAVRYKTRLPVIVLLPLAPPREARLRAILGDGRAWPLRTLAKIVGQSPRTVQRLMGELTTKGIATALGSGPSRSYALASTYPKMATWMLLPDVVPPSE